MPLRDVTRVIFDRDPACGPFNEAAALEAYHLVAKMDDESAREFVYQVVSDVVESTQVAHRDAIQKHVDRTVAKALVNADLDKVAEGLTAEERAEVKKRLLTVVSKAQGTQAQEAAWQHRNKSGRFTSFEHPIGPGGLSSTAGQALGVPPHKDFADMSPEQRAAYRGQYLQVANAIDQFGGLNGNNDVRLHYTDGTSVPLVAPTKSELAAHINPHLGDDVQRVEIRPYKATMGGQVVDLGRSLGGGTERALGGENGIGSKGFQDAWYQANALNSNDQMYNRLQAGSKVMAQVAPAGSNLHAAAKFGSLVGQHGSAAEAVFGPPVRRMAYRYRGTERRPDKDLSGAYETAVHSAKQESELDYQKNGGRRSDAYAAGYRPQMGVSTKDRVPTFGEREQGREAIARYLMDPARAPKSNLSALQLAAGHTPPSQGVLLNADGQIVTTAVGHGDDWYLPFNLKHLSQLKGGEYIRSRSTGGLTTEDIYTGLMTGARRVTVVSRSGTFSVEFDQDLRGGRRNSDKAHRMAARYGELLDAVQSEQVRRKPLDGATRDAIRARVAEIYGPGISPADRAQYERAAEKEFLSNPEWKPSDQAILDADVHGLTSGTASNAEYAAIGLNAANMPRNEAGRILIDPKAAKAISEHVQGRKADMMEQKEFYFKLNGRGYQAAQDALKEQFPYYIDSKPHRELSEAGETGVYDRGYVEPGALRPTAARATLYGGVKGPDGLKGTSAASQSARRADHAVPYVDRYDKRGGGEGSAPANDRAPEPPKTPGGGGAAMSGMDQKLAENQKHLEMAKAALADKNELPAVTNASEAYDAYRTMDDGEFFEKMKSRDEANKFRDVVHETMKSAKADGNDYTQRLNDVIGPKTAGKFSYQSALANPGASFDFEDATPAEREEARKAPLALGGTTADKTSNMAGEAHLITLLDQADEVSDNAQERAEAAKKLIDQAGLHIENEHLYAMLRDNKSAREAQMRKVKLAQAPEDAPKSIMPPSDNPIIR